MQYFIEGILGREYKFIKEHRQIISPEPSLWCATFSYKMLEFLQGKHDYLGCVDSLDYFISALAVADKPLERESIKQSLDQAFELAASVLSDANGSAKLRVEFAQSIVENKDRISESFQKKAHLDQ